MNYRSSVCRQCLICVWIIDPVFLDSVWFVYEFIDPVLVDSVWFVYEL